MIEYIAEYNNEDRPYICKKFTASSSEEVMEYLAPFKDAINATDNPDVEAFDAGDGDDNEIDNILG